MGTIRNAKRRAEQLSIDEEEARKKKRVAEDARRKAEADKKASEGKAPDGAPKTPKTPEVPEYGGGSVQGLSISAPDKDAVTSMRNVWEHARKTEVDVEEYRRNRMTDVAAYLIKQGKMPISATMTFSGGAPSFTRFGYRDRSKGLDLGGFGGYDPLGSAGIFQGDETVPRFFQIPKDNGSWEKPAPGKPSVWKSNWQVETLGGWIPGKGMLTGKQAADWLNNYRNTGTGFLTEDREASSGKREPEAPMRLPMDATPVQTVDQVASAVAAGSDADAAVAATTPLKKKEDEE